MDTRAIQKRLVELGYDLGRSGPKGNGVDGVPGRMTTDAIAEFQRDKKVQVQYPGTIGPKTIAALFPQQQAQAAVGKDTPAWFDLAMTKKGLMEGRDNAELRRFLKSDGKALGDPAKLPWCGDFTETCIALALPSEPLPTNPYLARNWMKFGVACEPTLGAVAVFWRGKKNGTSGHVGFVAGGGAGLLYILGGNQSNSVSVAPLDNARLLGCRWPKSVPLGPVRLPSMKGGKLSVDEA